MYCPFDKEKPPLPLKLHNIKSLKLPTIGLERKLIDYRVFCPCTLSFLLIRKILTKRNSNTIMCLLSYFMNQSLDNLQVL